MKKLIKLQATKIWKKWFSVILMKKGTTLRSKVRKEAGRLKVATW